MASQFTAYLILGSGRTAQHFKTYFELQKIPTLFWNRQLEKSPGHEFLTLAQNASHLLILVSDAAIEPLIESARATLIKAGLDPSKKTWIHFSGALQTSLAFAAHPLMSFPTEPKYSLEAYQRIPFILDQGAPETARLLPGLPNPSYRIDPKKRAFYHALCVLSGNFSTLLWNKFFQSLEKDLLLPPKAGLPYFEAITENFKKNPQTSLTGPLVRNDTATLQKNLLALKDDPFEVVYRAFIQAYCEKEKIL